MQADDRTVIQPAPSAPPPRGQEGDAPVTPLPAGFRLREFRIDSVIGSGGFGIVYLAHDELLGRPVALKEYLPESLAYRSGDVTVRVRSQREADTFDAGLVSFENEAHLLAKFNHQALVKVHTYWRANGTAYMVMPYYQGPTLKQALEARSTPPDEAWIRGVVDPVLAALEALHARRIFHRDIAPDNILLAEDGPVLLDFGAARHVIEGRGKTLTVILKPGYAPIEQYGEAEGMQQGAWTDLYALAAVIHAAMAGKPPPPSVSRAVRDTLEPAAVIGRGRYSEGLLRAVDQALAVHPDKRPQSVAAFRVLMGPAPEKAAGASISGQVGMRKTAAIAAAALVVLGAAGVGLWRMNAAPQGQPRLAETAPAPSTAPAAGSAAAPAAPPVATPVPSAAEQPTGQASEPQPPQQVAPAPVLPAPASAAPAPPAPGAPPPAARDPLQALFDARDASRPVSVQVAQPTVKIGRDKLRFSVTSAQDGFVYVFMRGTQDELSLLFPNRLDSRNRISAGKRMDLPRPNWELTAGGPPGTDRFVLVVSESPREFKHLRPRSEGAFLTFPPGASNAGAGAGSPALAGRPACPPGPACGDAYGAAVFEFREVR